MTYIEPEDIPEADLQIFMAPLVKAGWEVLEIREDYDREIGSTLMGSLKRNGWCVDIELWGDGTVDVYSYASDHESDPVALAEGEFDPPQFRQYTAERLFNEYATQGWLEPPS